MAKAKETLAPSPTPGEPVETIPGLGVIRARALRKAGWDNTASLKKATLADLLAVRGLSERKAQQILDYVHRPLAPETEPEKGRQESRVESREKAASKPKTERHSLQQAIQAVATAADALLKSEQASGFEKRLARQLGKVAYLAEHAMLNGEPQAVGEPERAIVLLQRLGEALSDASARERLGRKRQDRLADALRDSRRKLESVLGVRC